MDIAKKFLRLFCWLQLVAFAALTVLALPLHAQSGGDLSLSSEQMQELHKLQQKMRTVSQQLNEIRQEALEAKPELQEQQDEYQSLLFETMKEQGNDPAPALTRMREIEGQMQDQELAEEKRKQLIREYRQKDAGLQQASRRAMQDEKVREAAQELSQSTIAAMREHNSETEQLLQEMKQLRQEIQQMVAQLKTEEGTGNK
ncbi:hypothetical protein [Nitrosococcus wardiae]|uniref:Uncharacterized protein n=1 Tax=Nitrosococcus wardiae TaxID=1814290 RepID=A0A4P7BZ34_9GAMM|nr:hypothetical protein [Nitrosococcus wardiae]QBQ53696.1 hypothetical protein E3U44_03605 [Nitrosococcus wardiae]